MSNNLNELRADYAEWRRKAQEEEGFRGNFRLACEALLDDPRAATPKQWVQAAESVYLDLRWENLSQDW